MKSGVNCPLEAKGKCWNHKQHKYCPHSNTIFCMIYALNSQLEIYAYQSLQRLFSSNNVLKLLRALIIHGINGNSLIFLVYLQLSCHSIFGHRDWFFLLTELLKCALFRMIKCLRICFILYDIYILITYVNLHSLLIADIPFNGLVCLWIIDVKLHG